MTQLVSLSPRRNPIANRWNSGGVAQSIPNSSWTAVNVPTNYGTWGGPGSVPQVGVSAGTQSVFMRPGAYHIHSNMIFAANSTGRRVGAVELKNTLDGTLLSASLLVDRGEHSFAGTGTAGWSTCVQAFYNYAEIMYARPAAWQSSGAALNVTATPGPSVMVERLDCWNYVP